MFCKIENGLQSIVCFHCEYLRTQKFENFAFYLKQHVWADPVLKSGCGQFFNLVSLRRCIVRKIEIGFYWLISSHCEYLRAEKFEKVVFQAK